jgi:hypothetical protein
MNAKRIKFLLIALVVLLGTVSVSAQTPDYYNKHFVILVDQTPDVQKHKNMKVLYEAICAFLRGEDDVVEKYGLDASLSDLSDVPKNIKFDEKNDQISLFSFGIVGAYRYGRYTGDYATIHSLSQYRGTPSADVYDKIVKSLIHERKSFQSSNLTFDAYLENVMRPIFFGEDSTAIDIRENSGVTMSHYIYPCLLQFLDKKVGASEYYIFVVTNYKSGTAQSDSEDEKILKDMLGASSSGNPHLKYFHQTKQKIGKPFYETSFVKLVKSDMSNDNPYIEGKRLWLKSLQGTSVQINNNVEFVQNGYGSDEYDLNPVEVLFTHDNTLDVQKIVLELTDVKAGTTEKHVICDNSDGCSELKTKNIYSLPGNTFKLSDMEVGDSLMVSYVFYTMTKDEGKALIPYIYKAERCFVFDENAFVAPLSPRNNSQALIYLILIIVFVVVLVILIWLWIVKYRNNIKDIDLELHVLPVKTRFMEVKDNTVIDYPCWYYDAGQRGRYTVNVLGAIIPKHEVIGPNYVVKYAVYNDDNDDNFRFRPGTSDGEIREANTFYPCDVVNGMDFNFEVDACLNPNKELDIETRSHIIRVKIVVQVISNAKVFKVFNNKKESVLIAQEELKYELIVKPRIDNSDLWIGIDPGTTGSCIAYGMAGNVTDRNDIELAYNEKDNTSIYPSVVRIPDNSAIFKQLEVDVSTLVPDIDFEYGNTAESNLRSRNCFQSIKKLLGYSASQVVRNGNTGQCINISGQDLAYLLVRGVYKQFENYMLKSDRVSRYLRELFCRKGYLEPQRICVAVPNNYTLVKVQDMVDSVKRLGVFKEVHYIYESEAVMMNYIREEWQGILSNPNGTEGRSYIVYDMGGATINVTAFKLKPVLMPERGEMKIKYVEVETISKIGYCVGGDDIDYAIIQFIYNIPAVQIALRKMECNTIDKINEHQRKYKADLIELSRKIKLEWMDKGVSYIEKERAKFMQFIEANLPIDLLSEVRSLKNLKDSNNNANNVNNNEGNVYDENKNYEYLKKELKSRSFINKYVLRYVEDSINEIVDCDRIDKEVTLIMSGRSVLYPGIETRITETFGKKNKTVTIWEGFYSNGSMSKELVKTAVAKGACWYSMYCNKVKLVNNIITSSFGYIDENVKGKRIFVPLIEKNSKFDKNGEKKENNNNGINANAIEFVQMLGSNYEEILNANDDVKNLKINCIDKIPPRVLNNSIDNISVKYDNKGNFEYTVKMRGVEKPIDKESNPDSRLKANAVRTEIVDENNLSYMFAAYTPPIEEDREKVMGGRSKRKMD